MRNTKEKRRRRRKRAIRRMFWRGAIALSGVLILLLTWNLTSCALRYLSPSDDRQQEDMEEEGEDRERKEEKEEAVRTTADAADLLLVNKTHPLDSAWKPNLIRIREYGVEVDSSIADHLREMLAAGEKKGLSFWIASAYRSTQRQRELLDEDIEALIHKGYSYSEAYEEVVRETMPVGCSEHATGLAVDIVAKDYQILDEKQGRTDEILWLQQNCSRYGFILRYPEGKEDITKVSYESWHFRYVGVEAAEEIMSQGLTLEEYMESVE
ncbi:MAG: M15 family metallopeptidase [Lachnospiraceae bacterium]|jgi:D-alanyl-D-alanine carboxypeptidase|nr:M15 family metallopeptidase [Lachnospiraceae bacterium]MCI9598924.1 M15 family metallopeptidase [Lachnospiraceae bacterium]